MGSASQQFCLRWNNHQASVMTMFADLLDSEVLVDVTLACEGSTLKAHKVVLSACSPYFQMLFRDNPCQHPIVLLKGVNYHDLKAIIDFMYRGVVNISQEQLTAFLQTAETLRVTGLAEAAGETWKLGLGRDNTGSSTSAPAVGSRANSSAVGNNANSTNIDHDSSNSLHSTVPTPSASEPSSALPLNPIPSWSQSGSAVTQALLQRTTSSKFKKIKLKHPPYRPLAESFPTSSRLEECSNDVSGTESYSEPCSTNGLASSTSPLLAKLCNS